MLLHDCNPRTRFVIESHTTTEQQETEEECLPFFVHIPSLPRNQINHLRQVGLLSNEDDSDNFDVLLLREKHVAYLTRALNRTLPGSYVSLDASRSWIIYWTLHSLDLLNALPPVETLYNVIQTLKRCFTAERVESTNGSKRGGGGFGGGPQQMPHCATTYAAVMSLCILGGAKTCVEGAIPSYISEEALSFLKQVRRKLYQWFYSLRVSIQVASNSQSDTTTSETIGTTGFRVHRDGEVDVRGTYTVIAVCTVLDIITDELMQGVAEYAAACQTYEGGFGGEPNGGEAHGGYAYCALASLHLLGKTDLILDKSALRGWLARRQLSLEGGFSGRTNKLVDGCYSFWQGSCMALLNISDSSTSTSIEPFLLHGITVTEEENNTTKPHPKEDHCIHQQPTTQKDIFASILFDEQKLQRYILLCAQEPTGGLRDKPSKPRDFYHTCYNLSGLSVSQHVLSNPDDLESNINVVQPTHPALNISITTALLVIRYFQAINDTDAISGEINDASTKHDSLFMLD